jgi:hypothetical protein
MRINNRHGNECQVKSEIILPEVIERLEAAWGNAYTLMKYHGAFMAR